ncbi:MAG: SUMF1/EgtB/PvdO family nonheme iron enzyme [Anaeromyxobacteraceae bacterium]
MSRASLLVASVALAPFGGLAAPPPVPPDLEVVPVKGGCFTMGDEGGAFDARPAHEVCVGDFALGKYEVTLEQFEQVMGKDARQVTTSGGACAGPRCPVDAVSWELAQAFVRKLSGLTHRRYRLPTEAEWEYACRSGGRRERYCGGDDPGAVGWTREDASGLHPVGGKQPNALGLYDMSGNADEYVSDWYGEVFYWVSPRENPVGPAYSWSVLVDREPSRVARGNGLATSRMWIDPRAVGERSGFRVVLETGAVPSPRARPIPGFPGKAEGVDVLPKGGGAPGAAFEAWERKRKAELDRMFATLPKRAAVEKLLAMAYEEAGRPVEKLTLTEAQVEGFYATARREQEEKAAVKLAGGIAKGDLAVLFSEKARSDGGFSQTLVYMVKQGGAWTVQKELSRFHAELPRTR